MSLSSIEGKRLNRHNRHLKRLQPTSANQILIAWCVTRTHTNTCSAKTRAMDKRFIKDKRINDACGCCQLPIWRDTLIRAQRTVHYKHLLASISTQTDRCCSFSIVCGRLRTEREATLRVECYLPLSLCHVRIRHDSPLARRKRFTAQMQPIRFLRSHCVFLHFVARLLVPCKLLPSAAATVAAAASPVMLICWCWWMRVACAL